MAEEEKRKREQRTNKTEENIKKYSKEERYAYQKKVSRHLQESDLCHCGDEHCISEMCEIDLMRKRREEELRRARLIEQQRLKRIEEERIKKIKMEEEER